MHDLINLGKKVAIAGGKEAMKYFRKPNLDFDNKSQTHFDPVSKADKNTENIMKNFQKSLTSKIIKIFQIILENF